MSLAAARIRQVKPTEEVASLPLLLRIILTMTKNEPDNTLKGADNRERRPRAPLHLSTRVSSHRNAGDLIPLEVIESWLRGEYLVGITQSTGYQYIGWSLMLRGFYEYRNNIDGEIAHWGYSYIDLKDGDLHFAGVRIYSGERWGLGKYYHPIYWRSIFSKFVELDTEDVPRLYFGYIAHLFEDNPEASVGDLSYREYAQRAGDNREGFFEWYFKTTGRDKRLSPPETEHLQRIDRFWQDACRAMGQDALPERPDLNYIDPFKRMVLTYLADRDQFDSDLALLDRLHPNQRILALVDLELASAPIHPGTIEATLQPLERDIPAGKFLFRRQEQPQFD